MQRAVARPLALDNEDRLVGIGDQGRQLIQRPAADEVASRLSASARFPFRPFPGRGGGPSALTRLQDRRSSSSRQARRCPARARIAPWRPCRARAGSRSNSQPPWQVTSTRPLSPLVSDSAGFRRLPFLWFGPGQLARQPSPSATGRQPCRFNAVSQSWTTSEYLGRVFAVIVRSSFLGCAVAVFCSYLETRRFSVGGFLLFLSRRVLLLRRFTRSVFVGETESGTWPPGGRRSPSPSPRGPGLA